MVRNTEYGSPFFAENSGIYSHLCNVNRQKILSIYRNLGRNHPNIKKESSNAIGVAVLGGVTGYGFNFAIKSYLSPKSYYLKAILWSVFGLAFLKTLKKSNYNAKVNTILKNFNELSEEEREALQNNDARYLKN